MNKIHKILAFTALALTTLTANASYQQVVRDDYGRRVMTEGGDCVRTEWESVSDECYGKLLVEKTGVLTSSDFSTVYFDFNKYDLKSSEKAKLDKLIQHFKSENVTSVIINGYTDPIGTESYNLDLSNKRATTVHNYLKERMDLRSAEINVKGFGKHNLIKTCEDIHDRNEKIACLEPDRRVEVKAKGVEAIKIRTTVDKE